jgi:cytoskeletal protein RodZ
MADLDRGAYTPPTEASPLAFDARQPRRRRPLPVTLILSILILLGLIAAMIFIYRQGVRGEGDEPQPVGEPVGAVREPPPAGAQPVDPASGLDVYTDDGEQAAPDAPVFTPAPEAPIARPLPAPTPPPAVAQRPTTPPVTGTTGVGTAPGARPAPAPPSPAPTTAPARPAPTATAPAEPPAERPAAPAAAPPAAAPATPAAGGRVSAQIGAFNTRAQAQAALAARPGGSGQRIEEIERNGTTLYRAIVTGFSDRAAAQSYCSGVAGGCVIR